jgi:outer membrane protein TolC
VLALPPAGGVDIVEEDVASAVPPLPPLDADLARARARDEGLGNRLAAIAVQRDQLRVERDLLAPQVTAAVTAENVRTGGRAFERQDGDASVYALSLTWTMPLDLQAGELARCRQLQDEIAEADLALADASDALEVQLRAAWRNLAQLRNTVDLDRQRLDAEQAKMAATLTRYKAGSIDNLEVTRSKQDLDTAEIGLLDAQINLVEAVAAYRALLPMDAQVAAEAARTAAGAAQAGPAAQAPPP